MKIRGPPCKDVLRLHQDTDLLHAYIKPISGFGDLRAIPLKNLAPLNYPQSPLRSSLQDPPPSISDVPPLTKEDNPELFQPIYEGANILL